MIVGAFGLRIVFQALIVRLRAQGSGSRALLAASALLRSPWSATAAVGAAVGLAPSADRAAAHGRARAGRDEWCDGVRSIEARVGTSSRRVFFVGSDNQYADLSREVSRRGDMRLVGRATLEQVRRYGPAAFAADHPCEPHPTTLVISAEGIRDDALVAVASDLHVRGLRVRTLSDFYERELLEGARRAISRRPGSCSTSPRSIARGSTGRSSGVSRVWSRRYCSSSRAAPACLAFAVKLSGPGPSCTAARGSARTAELFRLTKFRTMTRLRGAGERGRRVRSRASPASAVAARSTASMRSRSCGTSCAGDLSLVGPRPEQPADRRVPAPGDRLLLRAPPRAARASPGGRRSTMATAARFRTRSRSSSTSSSTSSARASDSIC